MSDIITAPWTPEQVKRLNDSQKNPYIHPFTCGNRSAPGHKSYDNDFGSLLATKDGWICRDCDYTQDWAYSFQLEEISFSLETFTGDR